MKFTRYIVTIVISLYALTSYKLYSQGSTDILLQGFNWESQGNSGGWYNVIQSKAGDLKDVQVDMVWFPPSSDAGDKHGYLPRELYKLTTNYGTEAELKNAINALHNQGIKAIGDMVINHRVGKTDWGDFTNPTWGCWAATGDDEWPESCGDTDTGGGYSAARDLNHRNNTVRNDIKTWMNWMKNDIGFDGWRYDYVKGYGGSYTGEYNNATSAYFSVGELWDYLDLNNVNPHRQQIIDWIDETGGTSTAFDFTTKGVLQQAVNGELWRLSINGQAPGVIGWWPEKAVTFIDNHDTGSTQAHWPFPGDKVMQGYAYILTHPGIPCVFWDHLYDWGLHDEIKNIIAVRKTNGIHSKSELDIKVAEANLYAAVIDGKVAMKIGGGNWSPSGSDWKLQASGNNYAVWAKNGITLPPPPSTKDLTVHFKKPGNWSNATIYFWNVPGQSTTWPGEGMTSEGNGWYQYTWEDTECANLIFNDNGANQTADLVNICQEGWYENGQWSFGSNPKTSATKTKITGVENYPNPVISATNISISMAEKEQVVVKIYDFAGREVKTVYEGTLSKGEHVFHVSATDLKKGIYIYKLISKNGVVSKRMNINK